MFHLHVHVPPEVAQTLEGIMAKLADVVTAVNALAAKVTDAIGLLSTAQAPATDDPATQQLIDQLTSLGQQLDTATATFKAAQTPPAPQPAQPAATTAAKPTV